LEHLDAVVRFLTEIAAEGEARDGLPSTDALVSQNAALVRLLADTSTWCLLAMRADAGVVGIAVAVRIPKLDSRAGFLFIDELHVRMSWRRQGVGSALVEHALSLARRLDLAGIRLLARPENAVARAFYESLGFSGFSSILYQRRIESQGSQS
jgi:ribosomal protein S18 acetylase RimI-like enzyme